MAKQLFYKQGSGNKMIVPTICVVGSKDSGKTTVAKELIAEFSRRGLRVAAAKHSHHSFSFAAEGRDTALFEEAGARTVFFVGENQTVCMCRCEGEEKLKVALARYAPDADVLVAEGWRRSALPKVLVFLEAEKATEREFPVNIKAVVCPVKLDIEAVHFQPGQVKELADFLLEETLVKPQRPVATIRLNGKYLPVKGFVQQFITGGLLGMISTLRGVNDIHTVEISVRTYGKQAPATEMV
jgi:molybdopterin-guanine dinucleotide biosynthesis protein B